MRSHGLILVGLFVLVAASGRGSDLFGVPIAEIRFEPTLAGIAPAGGAGALGVGQPLEKEALRASIQALFRTGRYADVRVDAARVPGGIRLTYLTKPAWFIGGVRVVGVPRPPSEGQLVNATRLRLGERFTDEKLGLAARSLRSLLAEHGYREAVVEHALTRDPATQQIHVEFQVSRGRRALIGALLVAGAPAPLTAERIRAIARWPRGTDYRRARIQRGVGLLRQHFQKQDRWQAEIRVQAAEYRAAENEITLVVRVEPGPALQVRVEGASVPARRLRRYLPIFSRGAVDDDLLEAGAASLRDYLQSRGYFRAAVRYDLERLKDEAFSVVYRVDAGPRQSLQAVEIRGNRFFDSATIQERMQLRPAGLPFPRGRYSQSVLEDDLQAIRALYRANGFRNAEVAGSLIAAYRNRPNRAAVRIEIREGEPTFVTSLTTAGFSALPGEAEPFEFAGAPGQAFSEETVASDRQRVLAAFADAGFRMAAFDWSFDPDGGLLHYEVQPGERVRVGQAVLAGSRRTRSDVLARSIELEPGAPFSQTRMLATQRNLYDLGVFSKVAVALQNPDGIETAKNVLLQVEEARRWTVDLGGGAEFARIGRNTAELTNPAGDTTFSPRLTLETTRLNVRGKAHTMSFRTRLSLLQQRGLFTYRAPRWFASDRWGMTLSGLYDTFRNVNTFTGRRLEGALQFTQELDRARTVLYRYVYRRTSIDENTLNIEPLLVPLISQPVRVGLLSSTYISDRRDDPTDTSKGIYNTVNLALASKAWGSQPNFLRVLAQNSTYHRLRPRVVFARTVQLGVNMPWAGQLEPGGFASRPDPRIPLSERYFGGGANSHRGFPYNQAGPRDPATGFPIGGGAQFLNSFELRFPLVGTGISGVLFHDAGNVYSRPDRISFRAGQRIRATDAGAPEFDFDYMVHALGLGIRYRTPIGPVRFDLAYSPNPPHFVGFDGTRPQLLTGTGTFREQRISALQFHFSLGQTF